MVNRLRFLIKKKSCDFQCDMLSIGLLTLFVINCKNLLITLQQ